MSELRIPGSIASSGVATAAMRAPEGTRPDALFDAPLARLLVSLRGEVPADQQDYLADGVSATSPLTRMMGDYMAVRTHFFDTHLRATAAAGSRQVVLLGSGLDVRAYRMPWPRGTRIFEIDSAEVHAFKDELLARTDLRPTAERIKISSDVTGEWREMLAAAGFDNARPSSWLLEGLLFYLDRQICDDIVKGIAGGPAPMTWLAGDYATSTPQERADFAARNRTDDKAPDSADIITDGILPHAAPGPGAPPAQWLSPAEWNVTESTFVAHGTTLDRRVPDHWDSRRGGESLWLFHAVQKAS